ncbi:hypothetical protein CSIRO_3513 [Bradyrhizobiaceae bacterium SG-6C]|nr:hypothetical protein CSIRO_3513 [Bradyrhizobiaceae bacterium SG-6C]
MVHRLLLACRSSPAANSKLSDRIPPTFSKTRMPGCESRA